MKDQKLICSASIRDLLCRAVHDYAHAAYPPGGSECAQASREALLSLAERWQQSPLEQLSYRRRQRAVIKAALEYHCEWREEQLGRPLPQFREFWQQLLKGESLDDQALAAAQGENPN